MKKTALVSLGFFMTLSVFAQKTYIQAGKLIDVREMKVLTEQTIIIEDDKILEVKSGYHSGSDEDQLIDLKSKTVMPGLMDMHVHIEGQTSPTRYVDGFRDNEADVAYKALP